MALAQYEQKLDYCVSTARLWEKPSKQQKALSVVPHEDLLAIASAKYDSSAETSVVDSSPPESREGVIRDLLILELLDWFKNDFFSWTDQPKCSVCNESTVANGIAEPTYEEITSHGFRVELYKCTSLCCGSTTRFPRYNDPAKLLDTRTGRCGEWANCFGLICRALGFETRFVLDFMDHVWVEVFSAGMSPNNRWLHCDPCENKCDTPLLYEKGWGKKLNFVVAGSHDDVQDVTWRYTDRNHLKEILKRRACDEKRAVAILLRKRKELQINVSAERLKVLEKRLLSELVEFIASEQSHKASEDAGRESGSLAWRLARQEIHVSEGFVQGSKHVWDLVPTTDCSKLLGFVLTYNPAKDCYTSKLEFEDGMTTSTRPNVKGWDSGAYEFENIFRKEERDWKMVYLARQEHSEAPPGWISWKFGIPKEKRSQICITEVEIVIGAKTFHESCKISVWLESGCQRLMLPDNSFRNDYWRFDTSQVTGNEELMVRCELTGGNGNIAWQQAQLFRSSLGDIDVEPFLIRIKFNQL